MLKMDQVHVLRHKVLKEGRSIRRVARELGLRREPGRAFESISRSSRSIRFSRRNRLSSSRSAVVTVAIARSDIEQYRGAGSSSDETTSDGQAEFFASSRPPGER
jgi:hypothetical protein